MQEHDITVRREGSRWVADYEGGQGQLWLEGRQVHAEVAAPGVELLQDMKLMLAHLLLEATGAADGSLAWEGDGAALQRPDRKSTRLNSRHLVISYAVFCL